MSWSNGKPSQINNVCLFGKGRDEFWSPPFGRTNNASEGTTLWSRGRNVRNSWQREESSWICKYEDIWKCGGGEETKIITGDTQSDAPTVWISNTLELTEHSFMEMVETLSRTEHEEVEGWLDHHDRGCKQTQAYYIFAGAGFQLKVGVASKSFDKLFGFWVLQGNPKLQHITLRSAPDSPAPETQWVIN